MRVTTLFLFFLLLPNLVLANSSFFEDQICQECEGNVCKDIQCLDTLITEFKTSRKFLMPGEKAEISLSISNPFKEEIRVDSSINLGSGTSLLYVSGQDCSNTQCKMVTKIQGNGREELTAEITSNEIGPLILEAIIKYEYQRKSYTIQERVDIEFTECGKEECFDEITKKYDITKVGIDEIVDKGLHYFIIVGVSILLIISFSLIFYRKRKSIVKVWNSVKPDSDELNEVKEDKVKDEEIVGQMKNGKITWREEQ